MQTIATKLHKTLPPQVELDELLSAGHVGLVEASRSFDPARNVAFGAFARQRIRFAMIDYLRKIDMLTRADRRRVKNGELRFFELQLHLDDPVFVRTMGLDELRTPADVTDDVVMAAIASERVRVAVAQLGDRERFIIQEYFWRGRLLADIGADLKVHESWVSQIKNTAIARLRELLS